MSHRTQITLEDAQYARLLDESQRTGLGLAELVRRALDTTYGSTSVDERRQAIDLSFGSLVDIELDGSAYVDSLRRGLSRRIPS